MCQEIMGTVMDNKRPNNNNNNKRGHNWHWLDVFSKQSVGLIFSSLCIVEEGEIHWHYKRVHALTKLSNDYVNNISPVIFCPSFKWTTQGRGGGWLDSKIAHILQQLHCNNYPEKYCTTTIAMQQLQLLHCTNCTTHSDSYCISNLLQKHRHRRNVTSYHSFSLLRQS